MSDGWNVPKGCAVWFMPIGSELVDVDGVNATWTDGDGLTTSGPHGFTAGDQLVDTKSEGGESDAR